MNDELTTILDRISNGQFTEADVISLRQFLESGDREVKAQFAKFNVNIGEGKDIHIGDRIDQSNNAEAIKKVLLEFFTEKTSIDPTVKTPLEKYHIAARVSIYDSYARCREIDNECKKNLEEDRIRCNILPIQSAIIDQKILENCQEWDQDLSNFVKKAKEIISNNLEINSNVVQEITVLTQRYNVTEKQASRLYTEVGWEFFRSGNKRALECFEQSIIHYEGAENYENHLIISAIHLKSGKKRKALEKLKETKKNFFRLISPEQISQLDELIKQLDKKKFFFFD